MSQPDPKKLVELLQAWARIGTDLISDPCGEEIESPLPYRTRRCVNLCLPHWQANEVRTLLVCMDQLGIPRP